MNVCVLKVWYIVKTTYIFYLGILGKQEMIYIRYVALLLFTGVFLLLVAGQIARFSAPYAPPPGQMIDIGTHRLHIWCKGEQKDNLPTLLLDTGAGASAFDYRNSLNALSTLSRTCVYDRAGMGWSELSDTPQSANRVAEQVHALLDGAGIDGPILYIGHSVAGIFMRSFQSRYPDKVAGLIFIDASHPFQQGSRDTAPASNAEDPAHIKEKVSRSMRLKFGYEQLFGDRIPESQTRHLKGEDLIRAQYLYYNARHLDGIIADYRGLPLTFWQGKKLGKIGDTPILVLSAAHVMSAAQIPPGSSEADVMQVWHHLQADIAALSTNSTHHIIDGANHISIIHSPAIFEKSLIHIKQFLAENF